MGESGNISVRRQREVKESMIQRGLTGMRKMALCQASEPGTSTTDDSARTVRRDHLGLGRLMIRSICD